MKKTIKKIIKKVLTFSGMFIGSLIAIYIIALIFGDEKIVCNTVYQTISENPYVIPEKVIPISTSNLYVQYVYCDCNETNSLIEWEFNQKYKKQL